MIAYYLSQKLGSDKLLTLQEIKKLSIYGDGKPVTYEDVLTSVGDSSLITINRICDNLLIIIALLIFMIK